MRKLFYTILSGILFIPALVQAQAQRPTQNHGLATQENVAQTIVDVTNFILTFLASIAVLMIVISGIMYITSGGDSTRTETAKKMLTYSVAGLAVALLAYVIVRVVATILGAN